MTLYDIEGVTRSTNKKCCELVIHVKEDYGYRISCTKRGSYSQLINALKFVCLYIHGDDLPIYGVPAKSLAKYVTKKKDVELELFK